MPDGSGDDSFEHFLDNYRVTGHEPSYRMERKQLSSHFELIDDFLSALSSPAHLELAENSFEQFHNKGYLDETDPAVAYVTSDEISDTGRKSLNALTQVVLGKKHETPGKGPEAVPVKFTDEPEPFENFKFYMPTHDAVDYELRKIRDNEQDYI
ncbi:MAG: hypothetical protein ABEK04_02345 [Candidatus Nanohalobium sp.]